jgi:hypothetical protein
VYAAPLRLQRCDEAAGHRGEAGFAVGFDFGEEARISSLGLGDPLCWDG